MHNVIAKYSSVVVKIPRQVRIIPYVVNKFCLVIYLDSSKNNI